MPLQDLTPQLRTRLSRAERLVGLFVTLATLLMIFGLGYYVYNTGKNKGWFLTKAPYFTYLRSGAGLNVGDTVKLMGFPAGEIMKITAEDPGKAYDVYVEFVIRDPYIGYVWDDSVVKVKSAGLLGNRYLEVTKGGASGTTNKLFATYRQKKDGALAEMYLWKEGHYTNYHDGLKYQLLAEEPPELGAQMDQIVQTAKTALPNILDLTNQINRVLHNTANATARLDELLTQAKPLLTNLTVIAEHLREPRGSLGDWLIPTNLNTQLTQTLASANTAILSAHTFVTNTDEHLSLLVSNLNQSLENLAGITSNLHAQVDANTNLVTSVNQAIIHTDDLIQGLKRHWLLRSAFKEKKTNAPPPKSAPPPGAPRSRGR
jgi:ABC-type transporter Mla subunit MlaD